MRIGIPTGEGRIVVYLVGLLLMFIYAMNGGSVDLAVTKTVHMAWNNQKNPSPPEIVLPPIDRCMRQVQWNALPWGDGNTWFEKYRLRDSWFPSSTFLLSVMLFVSVWRCIAPALTFWGEVAVVGEPSMAWWIENGVCSCIVVVVTARFCGIVDVWSLVFVACSWLGMQALAFSVEYITFLGDHLAPCSQEPPHSYLRFPRMPYREWGEYGSMALERQPCIVPRLDTGKARTALVLCELLVFAAVWWVIGHQLVQDKMRLFHCINGVSMTHFKAGPVVVFVFEILMHSAFLFLHIDSSLRWRYVARKEYWHTVFEVLSRIFIVIVVFCS